MLRRARRPDVKYAKEWGCEKSRSRRVCTTPAGGHYPERWKRKFSTSAFVVGRNKMPTFSLVGHRDSYLQK